MIYHLYFSGTLIIAEVTSRIKNVALFIEELSKLGFKINKKEVILLGLVNLNRRIWISFFYLLLKRKIIVEKKQDN